MKKFIISSEALRPALKKLGQAINEKHVLPIVKNIYCRVTDKQVELITTDVEITISYRCAAETEKDMSFEMLIPFDFLSKVISVTKDCPVVIEHPSVRKAKIICDADEYQLNSLDKLDEFPKLPEVPKKKSMDLTGDFVKLLHTSMLTASKDELRPAMTRAFLDMTPEETNLVTTDSNVMYKHRIKIDCKEQEEIQFSSKMAKALEGLEKFACTWNSRQVCFQSEKQTIWARKFDDKFPQYRVVIPSYGPTLEINKSDLEDALEKACINTNATKQTSIHLNTEPGFIHFETNDDDYARNIHIKIPGTYSGTVGIVAVNAKKMLIVLSQCEEENIRLHIHSPEKAVLITAEQNPDYLGLIMPLLVNN